MSCVKLSLPQYDSEILIAIIKLIQHYSNIVIVDLREYRNTNPKIMYNNICKFIFNNYDKKIILLGDYGKYELPISEISKFCIVRNAKWSTKYKNHGYKYTSRSNLLEMMRSKVCISYSTSTFGFGKDGNIVEGDVFYAWYVTNFNKIYLIKRSEIIRKIFSFDDEDKIKSKKLWGNITLKNIKEHKDDNDRINKANMKYPIVIYKDETKYHLIDGLHRIIHAYINNIDTLKVIFMTDKQLLKTEIKDKKKWKRMLFKTCSKR